MKTPKEGVRLSYERGTSRYLDPKLGHAPLDVKAIQNYRQHGTNKPAPAMRGTVPFRTASPSEFTDKWQPGGRPITLPTPYLPWAIRNTIPKATMPPRLT